MCVTYLQVMYIFGLMSIIIMDLFEYVTDLFQIFRDYLDICYAIYNYVMQCNIKTTIRTTLWIFLIYFIIIFYSICELQDTYEQKKTTKKSSCRQIH